MMRKGFIRCIAAMSILLLAWPACSSTVSLVPQSANVTQGETFLVDLVLDTLVPGQIPGEFGGRVIVSVASTAGNYLDFDIAAPAELTLGPDLDTSGGNDEVLLWFEKAENIGVIGTYRFVAVGEPGSIINISVRDALEFSTSFFNALLTNQTFEPEFIGTSVAITAPAVPLPAAAWLMLSGLGILGISARRKRA